MKNKITNLTEHYKAKTKTFNKKCGDLKNKKFLIFPSNFVNYPGQKLVFLKYVIENNTLDLNTEHVSRTFDI